MSNNLSYRPTWQQKLVRAFLRGAGRLLLPLLARVQVNGREHFPARGPLLVVGNHDAIMEVVLMAVIPPWPVEMLGVGDIPPDPTFAPIVHAYGYIPVQRGRFDRRALNQALSVLEQGGVVGIFPEGGIWQTGVKEARRGAAWLSYQAQAPLLPVGFGGLKGAFSKMLRLQRPRMTMNIGQLLPPVQLPAGRARKKSLEAAASTIMARITALIPPEYRQQEAAPAQESFELQVQVQDSQGQPVAWPPELALQHGPAVSLFFYRPVLLDIFARNLRRPVGPLLRLDENPPPQALAEALQEILQYLQHENPYLLTYRFGQQQGAEMQQGLQELEKLAAWAAASGYQMQITPIHRYRMPGSAETVVEHSPDSAHRM